MCHASEDVCGQRRDATSCHICPSARSFAVISEGSLGCKKSAPLAMLQEFDVVVWAARMFCRTLTCSEAADCKIG